MITKRRQSLVLMPDVAEYVRIGYDDGAGDAKIVAMRDGNRTSVEVVPSLVDVSTWQDLGLSQQAEPPIMVMEGEIVDDQVIVNPAAITYGVGQGMLYDGNASFDVTQTRYTNEFARPRFYAALSKVLRPGRYVIDLTVGLNAMRYPNVQARSELIAFFTGRYGFSANSGLYDVTVRSVEVKSQPWSALEYVRTSINERDYPILKRFPIDQASALLIDIGNMTTDVVALQAQGRREPKVVASFALDHGVNVLRTDLAAHMSRLGVHTTLADLDAAIRSDSDSFGKIQDAFEMYDVAIFNAKRRAALWESIYGKVRSDMQGFKWIYIVVVGGGAAVLSTEIRASKTANGSTLGQYQGLVIPLNPHLAVASGLLV